MTLRDNRRIHVRWLVQKDLEMVLPMACQCIERRWTEQDFLELLRRRNHIVLVAECQGRVVGFVLYELTKTRIHLLHIGVAAAERTQNVGRQLVQKLIGKLGVRRRSRIQCGVPERNLDAQLFFRRLGFRAESIRRRLDAERQEDVYLMRYRLDEEQPVTCGRFGRLQKNG